jgi:hypothetical protein
MNSYDYFIYYIVLNKILFVLFGVWHFIIVRENKGETEFSSNLHNWKEYCEFMFIACMAILCLYLFNPFLKVRPAINYETRVLLFVFGWIVLLNCKWDLFFEQSKWFTLLQYFITGRNSVQGINTAVITSF